MPSKRKQLNVRLAPEMEGWVDELRESMRASLGIDVSQADVIRAALTELRKRYPTETAARSKKGGRP